MSKIRWFMKKIKITPKSIYLKRRDFLKGSLYGFSGLPLLRNASLFFLKEDEGLELTPYKSITSYNNFYEFGTAKDDPKKYSEKMITKPWELEVSGLCDSPKTMDIGDVLRLMKVEERVYRLRCVEGWSMVIPWLGFPLADFLSTFSPNSQAKYVSFETLYRPKEMRGQKSNVLDWPYVEGLRIDEAMHPLSFIAIGLYGESLLNQNGAPLRLVTPWKYGFKSIKSISRISFEEKMPLTSWSKANPREYGFYSNVNPDVDHPRWSQKTERRIGEWKRRKTLIYNGYGDEVHKLYEKMDLKKWF